MNSFESMNEWLLRTTAEGSVLILTVLGLVWTLGRHLGPRWRVALWMLVGWKLLVPAFLEFSPGIGNWFETTTPAVVVTSAPTLPENEVGKLVGSGADLASFTLPPSPVASERPKALSLTAMLMGLWLAGVVACLVGVGWRQYRFLRRSGFVPCRNPRLLALVREVSREVGVNSDFRVLSGPGGTTPAVFGFWTGHLVVPDDWETRFDSGVLRYILMHEIEHIRHRDLLLNWAATFINALHWFNPLVWIAVSRFQSDRELRCDANTLARLRPAERFEYGRTLLHVQKTFLPAPAIAGVAPCVRNHPTLQQRIQMITNPTQRKRWLNALLVPAMAGLAALSFGSATADEERPPREGEKPREEGPREGDRPREEGRRRDGDRPREEGREREGDRPREEERRGERPDFREREGDRGPRDGRIREGEIRVSIHREGVRIGEQFIHMVNLRGALDKMDARSAILFAHPDVPFHQVSTVTNALRDSGIRDVRVGGIEGQPGPGRPGDGDRPRPEGAPRDGDRPRPEGAPRDGDRPRPEGAPRDGDRPRPEGAPRDGDRPRPEGAPRDGDRPAEAEKGES